MEDRVLFEINSKKLPEKFVLSNSRFGPKRSSYFPLRVIEKLHQLNLRDFQTNRERFASREREKSSVSGKLIHKSLQLLRARREWGSAMAANNDFLAVARETRENNFYRWFPGVVNFYWFFIENINLEQKNF